MIDWGLGGPRVAVIGAGEAGRWFAHLCLRRGVSVTLEDVLPANLRRALDEMSGIGALQVAGSIEDAVRNADVAIDFVPDELESKLEIFSLLDRMAPPRTSLLTPTEVLSIADLASCTYRRNRCFGVRSLRSGDATVQVIHPAGVDATALNCVVHLLERLGLRCEVGVDGMESALTPSLEC